MNVRLVITNEIYFCGITRKIHGLLLLLLCCIQFVVNIMRLINEKIYRKNVGMPSEIEH